MLTNNKYDNGMITAETNNGTHNAQNGMNF